MATTAVHDGGVRVQVRRRGRRLRVGDRVRLRDRDEILATLDDGGRLDGLPFMPEMLALAGRHLTVEAVVHRTCDTIKDRSPGATTRRMHRTVHLRDVRCDGSAHGGCQAQCLIYWKEDWLERLPGGPTAAGAPVGGTDPVPGGTEVPAVLSRATRREGSTEEEPRWSCQATEVVRASSYVSMRDPRMWVADVRSGNSTVRGALAAAWLLVIGKLQVVTARLPRPLRVRDRRRFPALQPTGECRAVPPLDLRPGEEVEVRPQEEILAILDPDDRRGPRFNGDMLVMAGQRGRVLGRVERIIDERTGRMLKLRDCTVVEGVWCDGERFALCRRKIYTYWREAWLRRVPGSDGAQTLDRARGAG